MTDFRAMLISCLLGQSYARQINTYFLNKNYDFKNPLCKTCPDIECLYTEGSFDFPQEMSICFRSRPVSYVDTWHVGGLVMSFGTMASNWAKLEEGFYYGVWKTGPWIGIKLAGTDNIAYVSGGGGYPYNLMVWRHTCLSLSRSTGRFKLVENGKKVWDKTTPEVVDWMKDLKSKAEHFTLGCLYRSVGTMKMSMYGSVTDAHVFNRTLEDEDMISFTSCEKSRVKGNVISWEANEWSLRSPFNTTVMEEYDLERDICNQPEEGLVLVPHKLSFKDSLHVCEKLSGKIASYVEEQELDQITRFLSKVSNMNTNECSSNLEEGNSRKSIKVYVAGTDEDKEGLWETWYSKHKIVHLPWGPNRPYNDGDQYNCLMLESEMQSTGNPLFTIEKTIVNDEECALRFCPVCVIDKEVRTMRVRGLCPESLFNTDYILTLSEDGLLKYQGEHTSIISYDKGNSVWRWYDRKDNRSEATSSSSEASMLVGVHTFDFSNVKEDICSAAEESKMLKVKVTSCNNGEFTCNDGQCLDMEKRCDQISNCKDESDEDNCKMLVMKENYNKKIAPFQFDYKEQAITPAAVNVSFTVMDMLSIQEVNLVFVLKFRLLMEWYDHRLKYHNLKKQRSANLLTREEIDKLWIPFVVFGNTENNDATKGDDDTEVTITREGNYKESPGHIIEEINIFTGHDNRITFQQAYAKTFKCEYQLQLYPFDTQVCSVDLEIRELEQVSVRLFPHKVKMESKVILTQYIITKWSLVYRNKRKPNQGIALELVLKRRITNALLTTYLPTALILVIVYSTNFFKPFFFEAVVSVNLTALLVLTTLFISVSGSLPPTAYVKMIDIWLIFSQLVPFSEVLLHIFMDTLRQEEDREVNHHGKTIHVGKSNDGVESAKVASAHSPTYRTMTQRNEKDLIEARKAFYDKTNKENNTLRRAEIAAKKVVPLVIVTFSAVYWAYGLNHYFHDQHQ